MARAADRASRAVVSAELALAGFTSTATRAAPGTSVRSSSNSLRRQLTRKKIDTCEVAARTSEAGDKTELDRVIADNEDDRDCAGCFLDREGHSRAAHRDDHCHVAAHEFGSRSVQPIDTVFRPAVFDRDVLALDITDFLQALPKCAVKTKGDGVGCCGFDEPDHRHCRLLCPSHQRRRHARAAEERDERAPRRHSITSSARASSVGGTSRPSARAVLRLTAKVEFEGLLNRDVGRLCATQNLVDELAGTPEQVREIRAV
jgi:hypothetical protein